MSKRKSGDGDAEYFAVNIQVAPRMWGVLEELRNTGFYGNGQDVSSVVEELLRDAIRRAMVQRVAGEI